MYVQDVSYFLQFYLSVGKHNFEFIFYISLTAHNVMHVTTIT